MRELSEVSMASVNSPTEAAKRAAAIIVAAPVGPKAEPYTNAYLLQISGLQPPPLVGASKKEYAEFDLIWMSFRESLRSIVLKQIGRYLATVNGVGLKLLAPGENVPHIEDQAFEEIRHTFKKVKRVIADTRDSDLTHEQRRYKANAAVRLGGLELALRNAEKAAEADLQFKNAPSGAKPPSPTGIPVKHP